MLTYDEGDSMFIRNVDIYLPKRRKIQRHVRELRIWEVPGPSLDRRPVILTVFHGFPHSLQANSG
jgi:hypothetical protein